MARSPLGARRLPEAIATTLDDSLADPGYTDAFEIDRRSAQLSAEGWARACFEGAPRALRAVLVAAWRHTLLLGLGPMSSPDHVLGWPIVESTPQRTVLGVRSALLGRAHLVFDVDGEKLRFATLIGFDRRGSRLAWAPVGLVHRGVVRLLLTLAVRRLGVRRAG